MYMGGENVVVLGLSEHAFVCFHPRYRSPFVKDGVCLLGFFALIYHMFAL